MVGDIIADSRATSSGIRRYLTPQYEGARRPRSRRRRSTGVEEDKNTAPHGDSAVLDFGPCTDASSCSYYPGSHGRAIVILEAEAPGAARLLPGRPCDVVRRASMKLDVFTAPPESGGTGFDQ